MQVALLCAVEGHVPVEFKVPSHIVGQIDAEGCLLTLAKIYYLENELDCRTHFVGAKDSSGKRQRSFPALSLVARVRRRDEFYNTNVVVPMTVLVLVDLVAFVLPVHEPSERLSVSLTLLIVAVACVPEERGTESVAAIAPLQEKATDFQSQRTLPAKKTRMIYLLLLHTHRPTNSR